MQQGILICENSGAYVEKNDIRENIKANIALGGDYSQNTTIINNKISCGRCEGIFMIEGGYCFIHRNKIFKNYDGIICSTAIPEITHNEIKQNRRHGVILCKGAKPELIKNEIKSNGFCGLIIKDKSSAAGHISHNRIT